MEWSGERERESREEVRGRRGKESGGVERIRSGKSMLENEK